MRNEGKGAIGEQGCKEELDCMRSQEWLTGTGTWGSGSMPSRNTSL